MNYHFGGIVRDVFEDAGTYMKSGQLLRQVVNKINEIDCNRPADREHFGARYERTLNDLQSAGNVDRFYIPRAVTAFMVDRTDPHPGESLFNLACGTAGFPTAPSVAWEVLRQNTHAAREDAGRHASMPCSSMLVTQNVCGSCFFSIVRSVGWWNRCPCQCQKPVAAWDLG